MSEWKKSFPMWLTYFRIFLSITLFIPLWDEIPNRFLITMFLFIIGSLTDWLDGWWARYYNCESDRGKLLDSVGDKIFMLAAFLCLLNLGVINVFMVFLIVSRDILIGALRSLAAIHNIVIAARSLGKWKTMIQMLAVALIFGGKHLGNAWFELIGYWMLWASVVLSLLSGIDYFVYYSRMHRVD